MELAIEIATRAIAIDEVPIGAVIVVDGQVITAQHNEREIARDPTGHAEILALRHASKALGRWRLNDATIYVTLEPCPMCAGAMINARLGRLVYGAADPKAGAVRSLYRLLEDPRLNHRVEVEAGVEEERCAALLTTFFRRKRGLVT